VQLSPYRVVLAGVQTTPVAPRHLVRAVTTVGTVEFDERLVKRITVRAGGRSRIDKLYVNVTGQAVAAGDPLAVVYSPELASTAQNLIDARRSGNQALMQSAADRLRLWGIDDAQIDDLRRTGTPVTHLTVRAPIGGQVIRKYQVEGEYVDEGARLYDVADLSAVWVEAQVFEDQISFLKEGVPVSATTVAYPAREFAGRLALIQPHLDAVTRTLRVRFDIDNAGAALRPGMYATVKLHLPAADTDQFARAWAADWRDGTAVDLAAHAVFAPGTGLGGLGPFMLAAAEQAWLRHGLVLAVPEGAVIDTGSRKVVYREASAGVFEGVEVQLGPRTDAYYPVVRGLAVGDRVVTAGSFLIDAETRLNPAAGSIYVAGSGGSKSSSAVTARPSQVEDEDAEVKAALAKLSPADRKQAEEQGYCPVLGGRLGGMGTPVRLVLRGRPVFLCCKACEPKARADEGLTLLKLEQQKPKAATPTGPSPAVAPPLAAAEEAEVREALAALDPADRAAAAAQRFCPVRRRAATADPAKTLAAVAALKRGAAAPHGHGHGH
jgi:multidrug efflux pump subunit AcrA (membrane-fusion protein)